MTGQPDDEEVEGLVSSLLKDFATRILFSHSVRVLNGEYSDDEKYLILSALEDVYNCSAKEELFGLHLTIGIEYFNKVQMFMHEYEKSNPRTKQRRL